MPAAPATQPSPKIGTRRTSGRSPSRAGDAGIERRRRHTGDRGRDDQIDVLRAEPRLVERAGDGRASEFDGIVDEEIVRLAEVGQGRVLAPVGQHEVAIVDLRAGMQSPHDLLEAVEAGCRTNASVISLCV